MSTTFWRRSFVATVGALALTSCQVYFESAPSRERVDLPFGNAIPTGVDAYDSAITNDLSELWYVYNTAPYELSSATRSGNKFTERQPATMPLNSAQDDIDPAFGNNDLLLAFASDRANVHTIYTSARHTFNEPFVQVNNTDVTIPNWLGFDMKADGKALFVATKTTLEIYRRSSLIEPFTIEESRPIEDTEAVAFPSVSFDEQEVLFDEYGDVYRAQLSADGKRYENKQRFSVEGDTCLHYIDADFSADAMAVTYTCDKTIHIAVR
jgi:hypothetical protein